MVTVVTFTGGAATEEALQQAAIVVTGERSVHIASMNRTDDISTIISFCRSCSARVVNVTGFTAAAICELLRLSINKRTVTLICEGHREVGDQTVFEGFHRILAPNFISEPVG